MTKPELHSLFAICFCTLLVTGCATVETRPDLDSIEIARDVFLRMPDTENIRDSIDATQLLVADYSDQSFAFEAQIEVRPGSIKIASVNMWGGTLFSISYDGVELLNRGMSTGQGPDAEYLLGDVLLTYWDADWLRSHLQGAELTETDHSLSRTLIRDGRAVIEISYEAADRWSGKTKFTHIEREYILNIQTVSFSAL